MWFQSRVPMPMFTPLWTCMRSRIRRLRWTMMLVCLSGIEFCNEVRMAQESNVNIFN